MTGLPEGIQKSDDVEFYWYELYMELKLLIKIKPMVTSGGGAQSGKMQFSLWHPIIHRLSETVRFVIQ